MTQIHIDDAINTVVGIKCTDGTFLPGAIVGTEGNCWVVAAEHQTEEQANPYHADQIFAKRWGEYEKEPMSSPDELMDTPEDGPTPKQRLEAACKAAGLAYGVWTYDTKCQELVQMTNTKRIAKGVRDAVPAMGQIQMVETWGF